MMTNALFLKKVTFVDTDKYRYRLAQLFLFFIFKLASEILFVFLHLHNQTRHFTMKPFSCELQGVFSVSGPALNCKAQA